MTDLHLSEPPTRLTPAHPRDLHHVYRPKPLLWNESVSGRHYSGQMFIVLEIKIPKISQPQHWEYPVADDRGGSTEEYYNLVLLCADIREAFDREDPGWQLAVTLPATYWYLRGFNANSLEKYVDWFNVMSYDIRGIWDQKNIWTGPYLNGHTNQTEIEEGLDLLWRNDIPFASTEEGGSAFFELHPDELTGTVRACVPTWRNDVQGICRTIERVEGPERTVVVPLGLGAQELQESWVTTDNEDLGNGESDSKGSE
ncbi:glycoside hydrolase superfamily [Aspergillus egyptiacus]|nr:glycoside hydrolase superfamily [Aspergillus egyptiacus]